MQKRQENGFLFNVMLVLLALGFIFSFAFPVKAEMRQAQGLVCDTQEQIENWITLWKGGMPQEEAMQAINTSAGNPAACLPMHVFYVGMEQVKELGDAAIFRIMVVGVMTPMGAQQIQPVVQFMAGPKQGKPDQDA